eukprot:g6706.t1
MFSATPGGGGGSISSGSGAAHQHGTSNKKLGNSGGPLRPKPFRTDSYLEEVGRRTLAQIYADQHAPEHEVELVAICTAENIYRCFLAVFTQICYDLHERNAALAVPFLGTFVHTRGAASSSSPGGGSACELIFDRASFSEESHKIVSNGALVSGPVLKYQKSKVYKLVADLPCDFVDCVHDHCLETVCWACNTYATVFLDLAPLGKLKCDEQRRLAFEAYDFLTKPKFQVATSGITTKKVVVVSSLFGAGKGGGAGEEGVGGIGGEKEFGRGSTASTSQVFQQHSDGRSPQREDLERSLGRLDERVHECTSFPPDEGAPKMKLGEVTRWGLGRFLEMGPIVGQRGVGGGVATSNAMYPELLDVFSRTRCAPIRDELEKGAVSGNIGIHYSPLAGLLKLDPENMIRGLLTHLTKEVTKIWGHFFLFSEYLLVVMSRLRGSILLKDRDIFLVIEKNPDISSSSLEWRVDRAKNMAKHDLSKNFADIHARFLRNDESEQYWEKQLGFFIEKNSPMWEEVEQAGTLTRRDFLCTLLRYKYYVNSVPTHVVAPYNKQWLDNVQLLVGERTLQSSTPQVVAALQKEMVQEYYHACKTAVCNYCFLDESTRQRTAVLIFPELVSPWGTMGGKGGRKPLEIAASFGIDEQTGKNLLSEWEELERMLTAKMLKTLAAKELLELFHGEYADSRLIDLPKRGALADIESFRLQQERYRDLVVKRFAEEWNLRVLQIVREEVDANPELD